MWKIDELKMRRETGTVCKGKFWYICDRRLCIGLDSTDFKWNENEAKMSLSQKFVSVEVEITVSYWTQIWMKRVKFFMARSLKDSYFLDVCYSSPTLFHLCGFCACLHVFINVLPDLSLLRSPWLLEGAVLANSILLAVGLVLSVKMDR